MTPFTVIEQEWIETLLNEPSKYRLVFHKDFVYIRTMGKTISAKFSFAMSKEDFGVSLAEYLGINVSDGE